MPRYQVRVPVMATAVFEVEADSPQHSQGKVALVLQMGYDERLGFLRLEFGTTTAPSDEWETTVVATERKRP